MCYYTLGVSTDYNRIFILFASLLSLRMSVYARSHMCVCLYDTQVPRARHTTHVSENEPTWYVYEKQQKSKRMNRCRVQVRQKSCCGNIYVRFCRWISIHTAHSTHTQRYTDTRTYRIVAVLWLLWDIRSRSDNRQVLSVRIKYDFKFYKFRSTIHASHNFEIVLHLTDRSLCTTFRFDAE